MFGFGKGRMDVILEKAVYNPGEAIKGKARLDLKKPTNAKGVFVKLIAEETVTSGYGRNQKRQVKTLFEFEKPLDSEKLYSPQVYEYDFELQAPQLNRPSAPDGALGGLLKTAMFIGSATGTLSAGMVKWYVIVKLNVPGGMDVDKKVQISVQ